jgi:hypothetical protein
MAKTFPDILRLADGSSGSFASMDTQQIRGTATQIDDFTSASLAKIGSGLAGSLGKRALGHIVTISGSATKSPAYYVYSQTGSGDTNLSGSEWTTLTNWGKIVTSDDSDNVSFNHITASGVISASGGFVGDGSGLTGLTSAAISTYTNNGNNRVVTSVNSTTVNSEANLTFDGTSLNVNGEITSSKVLVNAPNPTDDFFLLKSGSLDSLKVNNQGVLQLGSFLFTPTAVKGGLYYDDDDDEFYAGKQN